MRINCRLQSIPQILLLAVLAAAEGFIISSAHAQVILSDDELSSDEVLSKEALTGYRGFDPDAFTPGTGTVAGIKYGIPVAVFTESAKATPWLTMAARDQGIDPLKASLDDWYGLSKSRAGLVHTHSAEPISKVINVGARQVVVDPDFTVKLAMTEAFVYEKPRTFRQVWHGSETDWVELDPVVGKILVDSYTKLDSTVPLHGNAAHKNFVYASGSLSTYPFLERAAEFPAGNVSYGTPRINGASADGLVIPVDVASAYDVYVVRLAVTFHNDIPFRNIEMLTFGITAPQGVMALELIPYRFDKDVKTRRTVSSPDLKINLPNGVAVGLGKVFEQEITYVTTQPTITAYGLQENEFSWALTDDAVGPGTRRFIAIVQVPKDKRYLALILQAHARTKGNIFIQGQILSSKGKLIEIELH